MKAESAGGYVVTRVPIAQEDEALGTVLRRIGEERFDALEAVYVLDKLGDFLGAVRLPDLFRVPSTTRVSEVLDRTYPKVLPQSDQEHVTSEALKQRATSVAVTDANGHFLGAVSALSLLDIARREHVEDLHRLTGIQRETIDPRNALEAPAERRARHRLPWLLVGLLGSLAAAGIVSRFEEVLSKRMTLMFFVPTIVYLADAIGTQTEAIVVRGLSLSRLSLRHLLVGELRTGLIMGGILAILALPVVAIAYHDLRLAISVSSAIFLAGGLATTVGLVFPWFLQRMGTDPAFGSGPVATVVQDVLSLLVYFSIATLIMK